MHRTQVACERVIENELREISVRSYDVYASF
jgi:hypothetical protein